MSQSHCTLLHGLIRVVLVNTYLILDGTKIQNRARQQDVCSGSVKYIITTKNPLSEEHRRTGAIEPDMG